jgi:hypothetical protein
MGIDLSRVEAGSNTSTVAPRVTGGDEKDPSAWGCNWATLFLEDINTGTWPSRLGSLGLGPKNYRAGEVQQQV